MGDMYTAQCVMRAKHINTTYRAEGFALWCFINTRRACARVTVVILSVCVCLLPI